MNFRERIVFQKFTKWDIGKIGNQIQPRYYRLNHGSHDSLNFNGSKSVSGSSFDARINAFEKNLLWVFWPVMYRSSIGSLVFSRKKLKIRKVNCVWWIIHLVTDYRRNLLTLGCGNLNAIIAVLRIFSFRILFERTISYGSQITT